LTAGPELDTRPEFLEDVRAGLCAERKRLSCRYLYDERGSKLFERICEQPEYYPTRLEAEILERIAPELAALFDEPPRLVELGSGSAEKTRLVIEALIARHGSLLFEPIDISRSALELSSQGLLEEFPELEVHAIASEYVAGLHALSEECEISPAPWLVAWLGSSIGNFHRTAAADFLRRLRNELRPADFLLVGVDMRKDASVLEAAYDDEAGVTRAFMKNLLLRMNRELGAEFDPDAFRYEATYDEELGRVEMHLLSERAQRVLITSLGLEVDFAAGEAVHLENSYKYSGEEIEALAKSAGFEVRRHWDDGEDRFREVLLALPKESP